MVEPLTGVGVGARQLFLISKSLRLSAKSVFEITVGDRPTGREFHIAVKTDPITKASNLRGRGRKTGNRDLMSCAHSFIVLRQLQA